jgi:thiamine kinase-like enzyme
VRFEVAVQEICALEMFAGSVQFENNSVLWLDGSGRAAGARARTDVHRADDVDNRTGSHRTSPSRKSKMFADSELHSLLDRVTALSGRELVIEPLEGGLTNRNYLVRADGEALVLRVAGADTELLGIDRDREAACARAAADAGVGPEVVAYLREPTMLVTRFASGELLTATSLRNAKILRRVAQALRRCHDWPAPAEAADFSPFETARRYHALAQERRVAAPADLVHALESLTRIERDAGAAEPPCLCHNDLLPANLIDDGQRIWIIDWEFAGRGDRFFDLGNLAANGAFDEQQELELLTAYFGEVGPQQLRRLKLMRLASDLREATWGYLQSAISKLHEPEYYQDYGRRHLARFLAGIEQWA